MKRLILIAAVWPLTHVYWMLPGRYDFPFFVTVAMLLWLLIDSRIIVEVEIVKNQEDNAWVETARNAAMRHAKTHGEVSSNDIRTLVDSRLIPQPNHPNQYGAIFSKGFKKTGKRIRSTGRSSRGRTVDIWELA